MSRSTVRERAFKPEKHPELGSSKRKSAAPEAFKALLAGLHT
jgi:hypothetical protein